MPAVGAVHVIVTTPFANVAVGLPTVSGSSNPIHCLTVVAGDVPAEFDAATTKLYSPLCDN